VPTFSQTAVRKEKKLKKKEKGRISQPLAAVMLIRKTPDGFRLEL
jgi:hypothetical protein